MVISHDISRPISHLRTHFGSFYPHGGACPARSTGSTGRSNFTVPHKKSSAATQLDIGWGDVHESNWSVTVAWNPGFFRWYRGYGYWMFIQVYSPKKKVTKLVLTVLTHPHKHTIAYILYTYIYISNNYVYLWVLPKMGDPKIIENHLYWVVENCCRIPPHVFRLYPMRRLIHTQYT